jgi:putative DNA primase/helicase
MTLQRSFYGAEDHGLAERLLRELPGILNWAIEGHHRLRDRGFFVLPASSAQVIQELEDLTSPVGAFLRERCEIGPGASVNCGLLFAHWSIWCEDQCRDHPGTAQSFGRDLRAAVPALTMANHRISDGGRERYYGGVGLKTEIPTGVRVRAEAKAAAKRGDSQYD